MWYLAYWGVLVCTIGYFVPVISFRNLDNELHTSSQWRRSGYIFKDLQLENDIQHGTVKIPLVWISYQIKGKLTAAWAHFGSRRKGPIIDGVPLSKLRAQGLESWVIILKIIEHIWIYLNNHGAFVMSVLPDLIVTLRRVWDYLNTFQVGLEFLMPSWAKPKPPWRKIVTIMLQWVMPKQERYMVDARLASQWAYFHSLPVRCRGSHHRWFNMNGEGHDIAMNGALQHLNSV